LHAATATACNNQVDIDLTWSAASEIPLGTTMFVQLLDANGQLIGQADGSPLGIRPDLLPDMPYKVIRDLRRISVGDHQPAVV
ncbi:MAG: hypothetical protein KC421_04655, partial [Anaerolineales bacterium]|nr:hypothetical protein [Anaerolineales bacterium]